MKIGYLIPEFPGQTHSFFWRERQALKELGIDTSLISTARPPQKIISHSWAKQAQNETAYLLPFSLKDTFSAIATILNAGPKAWFQSIQVVMQADDVPVRQKLRLFAIMPIAAKVVRLSQVQGWTHIHVHSCATSADIALLASLLSNLTYSLTLHNPLAVYGPNQKAKWHFSSFGVVITQTIYKEILQSLSHHLPPKIAVCPMGVNCESFQRKTEYTPYTGKGTFTILSCGRLNFCKGHADLIHAIALLHKQGMNVKLEIAGEDEEGGSGYRKVLEKLIEELGLRESVSLLGAVSEDRIIDSLESAHCFALASLEEPLGVAIMEAMAMSVPVIATSAGGVTELIDDGIDGLLVSPQDQNAIASMLLKIAQDQALAKQLSEASREKVVAFFNHRRSAEVLANLLPEEDGRPNHQRRNYRQIPVAHS